MLGSIPIDPDLALERAEVTGRRLAELIRTTSDPSRTAIGYWTIGDVSGHLTQVFEGYPVMASGGPSFVSDVDKMPETYDAYLRDNPERDPRVLADRVERGLDEFLELARQMEPGTPISWHGGIEIPLVVLLAISVEESSLHGLDIAQAEKREWKIAPVDAEIGLKGLSVVVPHFLTPEGRQAEASFRVKLRGNGAITFRFGGGALTVDSADEAPVDCRISATPVEFLLVGAGRMGQWGPIVKGKIAAYGRKPWLGLKLTQYLRNP